MSKFCKSLFKSCYPKYFIRGFVRFLAFQFLEIPKLRYPPRRRSHLCPYLPGIGRIAVDQALSHLTPLSGDDEP